MTNPNNPTFHMPAADYSMMDPAVLVAIVCWGLAGFFILSSVSLLTKAGKMPLWASAPIFLYGLTLSEGAMEVYFHQSLVLPAPMRIGALFTACLVAFIYTIIVVRKPDG